MEQTFLIILLSAIYYITMYILFKFIGIIEYKFKLPSIYFKLIDFLIVIICTAMLYWGLIKFVPETLDTYTEQYPKWEAPRGF